MTLSPTRSLSLTILLLAAVAGPRALLTAQQLDRAVLVRAIDSIAQEPIDAGRAAGMSIAVVRGADTILLKGYGYADLELDVPTPAHAVYEIGSVTKQFTAAAVLQLQERGLLSLDDEITTYLPDYPTQGHRITIRRLLDHTSGIKGYTEMPQFWSTMVSRALPRDSLVALFAPEPFDFAPGDAMIYNNSAYFLLGLIIEKASGQSYEDYIQERLFAPAEMSDSRYCSQSAVVKRRAHGYQMGDHGLERASYLDHTWPYAAGSICSTAWDMVAWNRALHGHGDGGGLLSADAYRALITPGTLNDGTPLRYAKGLSVFEVDGRRRISHGGGIFGFVSESRYYPDDDLIVVVLINSTGPTSPGAVATTIEELVLGKQDSSPGRMFDGDLGPFAGTYGGAARGEPIEVIIAEDSGRLTLSTGGREPRPLAYVDGLTFTLGSSVLQFVRDGDEVTELRWDQISGYYVLRKDNR